MITDKPLLANLKFADIACKPTNKNRAARPRHQGQPLTIEAGTSQGAAQPPADVSVAACQEHGTDVLLDAENRISHHQTKTPKTIAFSESILQNVYACEESLLL
jgi:hypothetical protein